APERKVQSADVLAVVDAEVVQGGAELPVVAGARAAHHQVRQHRGDAAILRRVVNAACWHQEVECRRANGIHALGQQRESGGEGVMKDLLHLNLWSEW